MAWVAFALETLPIHFINFNVSRITVYFLEASMVDLAVTVIDWATVGSKC